MAMRESKAWIYRHSVVVRLTHWINVACLTVLFMSGLQIFNAHPALYLGKQSNFDHPVFSITARGQNGRVAGATTVLGREFTTTGVLGVSTYRGDQTSRAFPAWLTLPSGQDLATARRWHFLAAWLFLINGCFYLIYSLLSGHIWRDMLPSANALRHVREDIVDHIKLRFPKGEEARRYNVLQQLTYLFVIFALLPTVALAGLTMSPGLDASFPLLLDLFGGRQSARTVHFMAAAAIVLFVLVHVVMVIVSGAVNNLRSMITGRYDLGREVER